MILRTTARRLAGGAAASALAVAGLAMIARPAQAAAPGTTTDQLTIRSGTSTGSDALGTIPAGTALDLECQTAGEAVQGTYASEYWAKVSYDGVDGFVSRAYVTVPDAAGLGECGGEDPAPEDPGLSADRQEVLDRGQTWVDRNVPYSMEVYTNGPDGRQYRTDCSGFVSMAYGLDTSYSTVTLTEHFTEIPKEDLRPGDIIGNLGPGSGGAPVTSSSSPAGPTTPRPPSPSSSRPAASAASRAPTPGAPTSGTRTPTGTTASEPYPSG
ncbi:SH3 domain-containing protein [Brachybacterium sp. GPGPB12]|uniref:SH3 domain-containing protein n=1 Tax=Brachybacterium sp. GPGPB12 TaxID=3023517 RepID=UPI003134299D